nr:pif-5 [Cnaphalocrocis medinalis granulovirus]
MTSFFTGLRRTNKVYPNTNSFLTDHATLIRNQTPSGINLNNPTAMGLPSGNGVKPGYNINGEFVSNAQINSVLRNNDVTGIRQLFPNTTNNQMNGLRNLRRADNVPDSAVHSLQMRKNNVKRAHPETTVRDRAGVEAALQTNPRLRDYLYGAGAITIVGVSAYLIINIADLVGSLVEAINRTGGSWYYRGNNGADNFNTIESCVLRYRTCGVPFHEIQSHLCVLDPLDATNVDPLMSYNEARTFCNGFNLLQEGSVCRGSDTNADPDSLQYLDISTLDPNQTIQCVEPYDLGDLIADLGLDWLLGDTGVITASSNSLTSVSDNFLIVVIVIIGGLFLIFIGFLIFKGAGLAPRPINTPTPLSPTD